MSNSSESSNVAAIATDNDVIATDSSGSNNSVPGVVVSAAIVNSFDLDNSIEPSSTPSIHTALGYCHVCNKQNRINTETYTCVQCNCGFIELFDINESDRSNPRSESLLDNGTTNARTNNMFSNNFINSNSNSQLNRNVNNDPSSNMNTAYCQWISRFNRNIDPSHISTSSSSSSTATNGIESSINEILNPSGESANPTSNTSVSSTGGSRDHPSRSNASFHYRLRRHTNPHSISSNNGATTGSSGTVGNSFSSTGTSSSTTFSPSFSSRHHHRHRFHRSPTSRFNFNFLDDDEILNDHGAIIITTLINQLRNTNRGAAPASEIQIDSLPVIDIDQIQVEKIAQCAICMEEFLLNETAKQLPCKHLYHDPCIVQWLKLHATCPVCRKNINGTNEQEQENEQNERTNLLNIFPISASSSLLSAAAVAAASSRLNQQNNSTSASSTESRDSQNRRSLLRNRQFFRIQIRQSINNNNATSSTNSSNGNSQTDNNEYSLRRSRRLTSPSTLTTSGSNSNSTVGSGNNMPNVILPRYSSILTADRSELANDTSSFSAFSIMNELNSRPSSSSSANTTGATPNAEANTTASGSRIGNLMDRIFSRCRPTTLSNRFSQQQQQQTNTSNQSRSSLPDYHRHHHHHHHHQPRTSPPSVSRLTQIFRPQHLRRHLNTDPLSSSTNSSTNSGTEFFQLFHRTTPLTETLLRGTDPASSYTNNNSNTSDNNGSTNSNANNSSIGSVSSFLNRASTIFDSEILNSPLTSNLPLETTLLSDLFDLSEEASQIDMPTRRSLRRSRSPNTSGSNQEAFTITIDDDDDDDDDEEDDVDDEDDESNTTNNNSSSNNSNPIIIDSDTAIESSSSSASSNETNLIDTIDLLNENNSLISSQSSNSTTAISSLQHAAKKRKTEST